MFNSTLSSGTADTSFRLAAGNPSLGIICSLLSVFSLYTELERSGMVCTEVSKEEVHFHETRQKVGA